MTYYLNFRTHPVGGTFADPRVYQGTAGAAPPSLTLVDSATLGSIVGGKHLLFGVHGFNVNLDHGARSLGQLDDLLTLTGADLFFAVLWPGDSWLPVVDYPFEGSVAIACGQKLAAFCRTQLAAAASFSFASHSLGARLVLEAVSNLDVRARIVCLTAGAINRDCLSTEYAAATNNADAISGLASHCDLVLKVAFRVGDPIADILHWDHPAFEPALGSEGPAPIPSPASSRVAQRWQIPDAANYGHGDYLPPGDRIAPAAGSRWSAVAQFILNAFRGQPQAWP